MCKMHLMQIWKQGGPSFHPKWMNIPCLGIVIPKIGLKIEGGFKENFFLKISPFAFGVEIV